MLSESLKTQALRELYDTKCPACGGTKRDKQSFCHRCYLHLPENMRKALYAPFSEGYAEKFDEAKTWLRANQ